MADLRPPTSVDDRPGAELLAQSGDRPLSGRYHLRAPIGSGASATVHLATDITLGRPVAVKVLHEGLAHDDAFLGRFRDEARAAAALNHPHITAVFDWGGTDDDIPFLVMEYLSGGSLRTMLDRHGPCSPAQTLLIGLEAARGLDYAHRRGFVHRDVKPANLLFDDEARLRIADFGLARALADAASTEPANTVLGTAKYASPEQAMGVPLDGRSDVYSLALVLIECVTGSVPFASDTSVGTLLGRVGQSPALDDEVGPLRPVLAWAGAPDVADRPSAGELASALVDLAGELDRPAALPIVTGRAVRPDPTGAVVDDITILGGAPVASPTRPDRADLTVIAEPEARAPRRWGRRRFEAAEVQAVGDRPVVADPVPPARADARLYDYEQEDDLDFTDDTTGPVATPRQPRTRRPVLLRALVAVAAVMAVIGFGTLGWQVHPVTSAAVPDLVGHDLGEARARAQTNGWDVVHGDTRADNTTPGQILAQIPPAGSGLDAGNVLFLQVSLGPPLVDVPGDLAGLPADQAEQRLESVGLTAGDATPQPSEDVPLGAVISVAPGAPSPVAKGTAVPLVVSNGPPPRTIPPDLVGKSPADVSRQLRALGLIVAPAEDDSEVVPKGAVKAVQPGSGAQVAKGSQVVVVTSTGPPIVAVPDVKGESVEDAAHDLEAAGLVVTGTDGSPAKKVTGTSPSAGNRVRKGSGVTIET